MDFGLKADSKKKQFITNSGVAVGNLFKIRNVLVILTILLTQSETQ